MLTSPQFLSAMAVVFLGLTSSSHAVLLDWGSGSVDWKSGSTSQSFDLDGTNPGSDITITITGDTDNLDSGFPNDQKGITVDGTHFKIANDDNEALVLSADKVKNEDKITITISFNYSQGVYASLIVNDVDSEYKKGVDKLQAISAQTAVGSTIGLTVTGSSANTVSGKGTEVSVVGTSDSNGSHSGDVAISSGTDKVTNITFQWSGKSKGNDEDGDDSETAFVPHLIALGNISFSPSLSTTPEVGSSLGALLLCGGLALGARWRRRIAA